MASQPRPGLRGRSVNRITKNAAFAAMRPAEQRSVEVYSTPGAARYTHLAISAVDNPLDDEPLLVALIFAPPNGAAPAYVPRLVFPDEPNRFYQCYDPCDDLVAYGFLSVGTSILRAPRSFDACAGAYLYLVVSNLAPTQKEYDVFVEFTVSLF
jgi:hypothetical protein